MMKTLSIALGALLLSGCAEIAALSGVDPQVIVSSVSCAPDSKSITVEGTVQASVDQHLYVDVGENGLLLDAAECGDWEVQPEVPGELHCARRVREGSSETTWRVVYTMAAAEHMQGFLNVRAIVTDQNDEMATAEVSSEVNFAPGLPYCRVTPRGRRQL